MLQITTIPYANDNYAYLLQSAGKVAIVDAGNFLAVQTTLQKFSLTLDMILCTHHHADHIAGNSELKKQFPQLKIYAHKNATRKTPEQTHFLKEGDKIILGDACLEVIENFGHTQSCISFLERQENILFSGDCLFLAGCGRIFEGTIEQMYQSFEKLKKLDKQLKIYFGHNYSINNLKFAQNLEPSNKLLDQRIKMEKKKSISPPTSLQEELTSNPFMRLQEGEIKYSVTQTLGEVTSSFDLFQKIRYLKDRF